MSTQDNEAAKAAVQEQAQKVRQLKADKAPADEIKAAVAELLKLKEAAGMDAKQPAGKKTESKGGNEAAMAAVQQQADKVRQLKADKASAEEIKAAVAELLKLKEAAGMDAKAPAGKKNDKKGKGKEKKEAKGAKGGKGGKGGKEVEEEGTKKAGAAGTQSTGLFKRTFVLDKPTVTYDPATPPFASLFATACNRSLGVRWIPKPGAGETELRLANALTISSDHNIARFLARYPEQGSTEYPYGADEFEAAMVDQWLARHAELTRTQASLEQMAEEVNQRLKFNVFLAGTVATLADYAFWYTFNQAEGLRELLMTSREASPQSVPHLDRWYTYLQNSPTMATTVRFLPGKFRKSIDMALATSEEDKKKKKVTTGSFNVELPGATFGQVVTRFPPEPSGYMHVGHAKAVILNSYFARQYQGKLIVRFDDTNPAKEKAEYEENILGDLETLEIQIDQITHTSDHFETLLLKAQEMFENGLAYVDEQAQEDIAHQRYNKLASPHRDQTVEQNLALWEEMKKGTEKGQSCVARARINYAADNASLRDPSIYRCVATPHHIHGDKYKVYPTYDFACPIVDVLEGVTHTLRTSEYKDRDEQYHWFLNAMNLRDIHIWEYSRVNFAYTLLSKRKLTWFVDNNVVRGWDDPRFPTVQGMLRRGLQVKALKEFLISMGASTSDNLMSFSKMWNINKKIIDPIAPRFMAIDAGAGVPLLLSGPGVPEEAELQQVDMHPKRKSVGSKNVWYSSSLLLEPEDAALLNVGDEVTLMHWGNMIVEGVVRADGESVPTQVSARLHLAGDFKSTELKLSWVSNHQPDLLVPCNLFHFDLLLNKKQLEKKDDFKDHLNPVSEKVQSTLGQQAVQLLKKGDVVQFERRGYFVCDRAWSEENPSMDFFNIPDGHDQPIGYLAADNVQVEP